MLYKCQYCKTEFNACPSNRRYGGIFCSRQCSFDSRKTRTLRMCKICKKEFAVIPALTVTHCYCSKKCAFDAKIQQRQKVMCGHCGKVIEKTKSRLKKVNFCSRSCVAKYYYKQRLGARRSQAEIYLASLIKKDFPNMELLENARNVLSCGLEIDLFLPSYNLAIELNGPCHYFNIHGDDNLRKVQSRDAMKHDEIQRKGYKFIVLDISCIKNKKTMAQFLDFQYTNNIKPIIT